MPPVIAGLVAVIGVFGVTGVAATEIAVGILFTAASLVITGVSALLRKNPDTSSLTSDSQNRTVTSRTPVAPWRVVMGEVGELGGTLTYMEVTGANGEFLHLIITLAGHEVHDIPTMYFDGVAVPVNGSGDATGTFAGFAHWEKGLGTSGQTAYASLVASSAGLWTTNHRQRGRANSYVRLKWSSDLFPNGVPNITFDVQGYNQILDPRTSTTGYSTNSALCLRAYLTNTSWGMGATSAEINDTVTNAAANICDELVPLAAGGNESRYTTNGTFDTSQLPKDIIPGLLSAMAGQAVYTSGQWGIYPAAWRSTSASFTDSDLRDKLQVSTNRSHRDLFNGVKGVYVSPSNNWQPSDFPAFVKDATRGYGSDAYLAEDSGERIWADIQLPYTITASCAQRLAKIHLERNRRQKTVTAPYNLSAYRVQPPDTIQLTHPRFSWSLKTFEVSDLKLSQVQDNGGNPIIGCDLILAESDANVYAWSTTDDLAPTAPPAATVPSTAVVHPISALGLTSGPSTALLRSDGIRISRILAQWTSPVDQMVLSGGDIVIEYRTHAGPGAWTPAGPCSGYATSFYIDGVNDGVSYDVRVFAENSAGTRSVAVEVDNHTVSQAFTTFSGNLSGAQAGKNMVANPGFEFNTVGAAVNTDLALGAMICDNWTVYSLSAFHGAQLSTGASRTGTNALLSRLKQSVSVPSDGVFYENRNLSVAKISVAIGDIVRVSGQLRSDHSIATPAGIAFIHRIGLAIFDATDTWIGELFAQLSPPAFTGAYALAQASLQIPATVGGGVPSYVRVQASGFVQNTSGSTFSTSTNAYADLRFDDVKVVVQNTAFDLTPLNTSGTPTTTNLCTQATTTTTINVAASSFQYGDGTVSYSSGSVNPGALGTWFIYADDPTYTGGAVTYQATANRSDISGNNGRIYFGMVTTVGGGGGASNNTGGTGGGKVGGL